MDSYDIIAKVVKDYWESNFPQDVVLFFQQKYSWDDKWERCEELVECHGSDDYENMTFLSDFCEGQTEVKDVVIIPLREVTAFYYDRKIENHEGEPHSNADRIRAMTNEELAEFLLNRDLDVVEKASKAAWFTYKVDREACLVDVIDWLKQEVET